MRIHYLQHVPFEDAANIGTWALEQGFELTETAMYDNQPLPPVEDIDWLCIMGGPMNIYEHDKHPWLVREKKCIKAAIDRGVTVIGVCLGGQLIADVLGGRVTRGRDTEIGWFPIRLTDQADGSTLFADLPRELDVFHWHGDTFAIPPGAVHLAESDACTNQAFQYGDRVLGLQFHMEYSADSIRAMLQHCSDELVDVPFIASAETMVRSDAAFQQTDEYLRMVLTRLLEM